MLTIDKLIEILKDVEKEIGGETQVAMSTDPEGNGFHTVEEEGSFSLGRIESGTLEHSEPGTNSNAIIIWPGMRLTE